VLAAVVLALSLLVELVNGVRALSWPTASGQVVAAEVVLTGCRRQMVSPRLTYQYRVDGRDFQSSEYSFNSQMCMARRFAVAVLESKPVGSAVQVRHHPDDPSRALLAGQEINQFTVISVVVMAVVWIGLVAAFVQRRRSGRRWYGTTAGTGARQR
jgi:Protein of unknown function (DUF3592)